MPRKKADQQMAEIAGKRLKLLREMLYMDRSVIPGQIRVALSPENGRVVPAKNIGHKMLTQPEIAKNLYISVEAYRNYETGDRVMSDDTAKVLADILTPLWQKEINPSFFQGYDGFTMEDRRYYDEEEEIAGAGCEAEKQEYEVWKRKVQEQKTFFAALLCQYEDVRHEARYDFAKDPLPGPNRFILHTEDGKPTYLSDGEMQQVVDALADTLAFELFKIERKRNAKK